MWQVHTHRLAVGTNKGLIILDMLTNMLIQVIGSEKKLLGELWAVYITRMIVQYLYTAELSGCDDHDGSSVPRARLISIHNARCCALVTVFFPPTVSLSVKLWSCVLLICAWLHHNGMVSIADYWEHIISSQLHHDQLLSSHCGWVQ